MQGIAAGLNTTKNKMKTSLGKLHNDESGLAVNRQQPRSGTSGTNKHKSKSAGKKKTLSTSPKEKTNEISSLLSGVSKGAAYYSMNSNSATSGGNSKKTKVISGSG